ncbi:hypothetical protein Hypma_009461 [Hypsizygus marmoreus]|uniref:Uncharacterized protein n=1 Tax=Hypsizygus marmoreus TaxID=39966 RepID=A0A369JQX1_HYPMA|nr:hypothetical protein Hypma_009461 [Hypsizygus marmoreus]
MSFPQPVLPADILRTIYRHVAQADALAFSSATRTRRHVSLPLVFSDVTLEMYEDRLEYADQALLDSITHVHPRSEMSANPNPYLFKRKVTIYRSREDTRTATSQLFHALHRLPNLHSLSFCHTAVPLALLPAFLASLTHSHLLRSLDLPLDPTTPNLSDPPEPEPDPVPPPGPPKLTDLYIIWGSFWDHFLHRRRTCLPDALGEATTFDFGILRTAGALRSSADVIDDVLPGALPPGLTALEMNWRPTPMKQQPAFKFSHLTSNSPPTTQSTPMLTKQRGSTAGCTGVCACPKLETVVWFQAQFEWNTTISAEHVLRGRTVRTVWDPWMLGEDDELGGPLSDNVDRVQQGDWSMEEVFRQFRCE